VSMRPPLRILSLEDDPKDAELVEETLASDGITCEITRVETEADFIASLERGNFDVILADYTLPSFDGLSALNIARQDRPHIPFIFVSGTLDEEVAIEALKNGATDYVFKTRLSRIVPSVQRALREAEERIELRRAEQALRRSEAYLAEAQSLSHTGSFGWDVSSGEIYWSRETFRIFEYEPAPKAAIELVVQRTHPEDKVAVQQLIERVCRERKEFDFEHRLLMPDGSVKYVRVVGRPSEKESGRFEFVGAVTDITERKRAEGLLAGEKRLLEMVARGNALATILDGLCRLSEELLGGPLVSILLVSADGKSLTHGAAPNLPKRYTDAIDGGLIGPSAGSCGTAAYRKEPVVVSDIDTDPLWADYRHLALSEGLRACWSTPIFSTKRKVLGTFAVYCREPASPTPEQHSVVEQFTNLASIAIERTQAQEALRRSEAYLAEAQRMSLTGSFCWSVGTGELVWSDETFRIFGYDPETKPTLEVALKRVYPEDIRIVQQTIDQATRDNTAFDFEHRLLMPDESIKYIRLMGHPSENESGRFEFVGAITDITERKRAEADLQRAVDEIKKLRDQLYKENIALREEVDKSSMFEEIVGESPALQAVLALVARVASTDSTVLIAGETGTGKELIARAIHKRSPRSSRAFVSVNCAAIPASLIASELFGHEKGAFTGALQRRLGRFELAEGGTIFLDEIGELPAETQVALLRILQEREFERIGGSRPIRADIRVITATNRDLETAVTAGDFRKDLFYRLNVFPIEIPPLRERKEDIPTLVEYFIHRYSAKAGKKMRTIEKGTMELLRSYSWPGNIRELQNVIERSVILCETDTFSVDPSWLSLESSSVRYGTRLFIKMSGAQEKEIIENALAAAGGRVSGPSGAAAQLGMPASTLESKIRSLKINKFRFKNV
jgi:PAS domain S-box-containing protein